MEKERSEREMGDEDEKVKQEALQIIESFQVLPRLVVFDLDFTLWPFCCALRCKDEKPYLYHDAKGILYALKDKGVDVAIASKSNTPDKANTFLEELEIKSMFVDREIYFTLTNKTEHFQKIHSRTGVPFTSMLFYDDEDENIEAVSKMGVTSILVDHGITLGALKQGLTKFSQKQ